VLAFLGVPAVLCAAPGPCLSAPGRYQVDEFKVRQIRIDAPLAWLGPVHKELDRLAAGLPLKERSFEGRFNVDAFNAGLKLLENELPELSVDRVAHVAVRFGWAGLENCDPETKLLDVVYHVYNAELSPPYVYLFHDVERLGRAPVGDRLTRTLAAFNPQPYIGYDRSRNFYGGSRLAVRGAGPLRSIQADVSGSSTSLLLSAALTGSHDFGTGLIQRVDWRAGYLHSDVPSTVMRLRQGTVRGFFSAATRASGAAAMVGRFGLSLEAGNQQTDLASSPPGIFDSPRLGYGALKAYFGQTLRAGPFNLRNSYGFQLGKAGDSWKLGYSRHLVDSRQSASFPIADHHTLSVQTRFNAGFLNASQGAPVAERFFGGNVVREFIPGDLWNIAADPLIRSFPQNRFALTPIGLVGGNRFFSANVTVAATVWQVPLVPSEALKDPQMTDLIELQMNLAETVLVGEYRSQSDQAVTLARHTVEDDIRKPLATLQSVTQSAGAGLNQNPAFKSCQASLKRVTDKVEAVQKKLDDNNGADLVAIRTLSAMPDTTPLKTSYLKGLENDCGNLASLLSDAAVRADVAAALQSLSVKRQALRKEYDDLQNLPSNQQFEKQAERDMRYPRRVIGELLRDVNLLAVSPVLMFDTARLWQSGLPAGDVRYAGGLGLRFSLVNLDLTAGYCWTVGTKPGEGRGALLFTFGVSNLFR
jgi:hypothetical protein